MSFKKKDLTGCWGMPRVEDENDPSLIKPEFSKVYRDERHNMDNCVVRIVRDLGYWLECSYGAMVRIVIARKCVEKLPESKFENGELVYAIPKGKYGVVYEISWHFKRKEFVYYLEYENRKSSRMYFSEELENVS